MNRLESQLAFIREVDKLKQVFRQTLLMDGARRENDAEHSWHLALMALILREYAAQPELDLARVVKMVTIHDLVEIDAGDTFRYDAEGNRDKAEREQRAASRIFGMLPPDQAREIRMLWDEFEERSSPESQFAAALDRLHPMLHNFATQGAAWRKHTVTRAQVLDQNRHMEQGAPALWAYAENLIDKAVQLGYLAP